MSEQVKVGQVWRRNGGAELRVMYVTYDPLLRQWPTCPHTGEAYSIEAKVREDYRVSARGIHTETVRFWRAAFCCKGCGK